MRRSFSSLVLLVGSIATASLPAADKLPDQAANRRARRRRAGPARRGQRRQCRAVEAADQGLAGRARPGRSQLAHGPPPRRPKQWLPLAEVVSQAAQDPDQEQYRTLRDRAAGNPRALRDLARWCAKHDWNDRARLHYAAALGTSKADASFKAEAVEKLNLVQVEGNWLTKEKIQARQEEAKADSGIAGQMAAEAQGPAADHRRRGLRQRDKAIAEFARARRPGDDPRPRIVPARRRRGFSGAGGEEAGDVSRTLRRPRR